MNKKSMNSKKNIIKIVKQAKKNTKPHELLGHSVKIVDKLRDAYNKQSNKMTPQAKSIMFNRIKNGSYGKMRKEALKNLDGLIEKSDSKNQQLESLKQMITNKKRRRMSKQKKELAAKLFTSITHNTKEKRAKSTTRKKRKKQRKSKTIKNLDDKEMKGGVITGLWGDVFYIFADVFATIGWIPMAILGVIFYELVDILQVIIGVGDNNYLTFDSLSRFLHTSDFVMAPYEWLASIGSWPGELVNDTYMIMSNVPMYTLDIAERGAEALETVGEFTINDAVIPLASGTETIIGDQLNNIGNAVNTMEKFTTSTIVPDAVTIGSDILASTESFAETSLFPSMSIIISLMFKVIISQTFLAALLTSIPAYLIYERENIKNAYDNISKYGWLISLFPTDIEADNDFYCEEKINLKEEMNKIDRLFDIDEIFDKPRILLKNINELKINGRQLVQFQEVIETDLKNIDINIFTRKELFESDFEKFRLQVNISKNIEFTRKMITFRKQIIEKINEIIISIESMKLNKTFEKNKDLLRVVLGKIINTIKETIKDGYEYCMEKSGNKESVKEVEEPSNNKTKKNILHKSLSRTQKEQQ